MSTVVATSTTDLGAVEDKTFRIGDFGLQNGETMAEVEIAYETYGRLATRSSSPTATRAAIMPPAGIRRTATSPAGGTG
jgi:homoserine acetyltransferase